MGPTNIYTAHMHVQIFEKGCDTPDITNTVTNVHKCTRILEDIREHKHTGVLAQLEIEDWNTQGFVSL